MNDDATLLRRYSDEDSEAAFTELVHRYLNLVYGSALRRTGGDAHRAADVAQQVFTQLARHARKLSGHPVLSAWLHTATRNAAIKAMLSDQRRQARETEAFALSLAGEPAPDWARVRPLLDAAIDRLPEADRAAVVLRFLQRCTFADIGAALRISEDAARMRVDRALEKLRVTLARRKIASTAAALAAALADQAVVAAPVGLATSVASAALSGAAGLAGGTAVAAGIFSMKTTHLVLAAVALAVSATAIYEFNRAHRLASEVAAGDRERESLRAQLRASQASAGRAAREGPAAPEAGRANPAAPATAVADETGAKPTKTQKTNAGPKVTVDTHYRALFRQLGFTAGQSAQFKALVLQSAQHRDELIKAAAAQNPSLPPALLHSIDEQTNSELLAGVRAAFGDSTVQAMQHYNDTFPLRGPLEELAKNLFYTDAPLTAAQADQLVNSTADSLRNSQGRIDLDRFVQTEFYAALLDHSPAVLSPPQIAALQQMLEDDIAWRSTLPKKTPGTKPPG